MTTTPITDRESLLATIREGASSNVLIIGGGINGIATFRELALNGVDVTLVERDDFASGASSASSHMIHGGIRYLENGEFRLVKESIEERNRLLANAPHYVKPLRTTIPLHTLFAGIMAAPLRFITHKQRTPKARGALLVKVGLIMYDTFAGGDKVVPRHEFHGRRRSLEIQPDLDEQVKYTATYYDAAIENPERLALDVLRDGLAAGPHARAVNHVEAVGVDADGRVLLRDRLTGDEITVAADVIVNASGPWSDLTNRALGIASKFIGGTKGSHIVVDHSALYAACAGREMFFENRDGRIVLIYPLGGRVLIGTTDLPANIETDDIVCTEEEIDYFVELVTLVFPRIQVGREHIVFSFSGVRPLPRIEDTLPGFVSRDYRIEAGSLAGGNVKTLTLVGGKWTTFRALGEHLSDRVLDLLAHKRTINTVDLTIGGGAGFPESDRARSAWEAARVGERISAGRAIVLLERYGTRADAVIEAIRADDSDFIEFGTSDQLDSAEVRYLVFAEQARHLDDVLYRRTALAMTGRIEPSMLPGIAAVMAEELKWTPQQVAEELDRAERLLVRSRSRALVSA